MHKSIKKYVLQRQVSNSAVEIVINYFYVKITFLFWCLNHVKLFWPLNYLKKFCRWVVFFCILFFKQFTTLEILWKYGNICKTKQKRIRNSVKENKISFISHGKPWTESNVKLQRKKCAGQYCVYTLCSIPYMGLIN